MTFCFFSVVRNQHRRANAPEGLSCPQRGRRRKPEGEKAAQIVSKAREGVKVAEQDIQALEGKKTALEGEIEALEVKLQGRQQEPAEHKKTRPAKCQIDKAGGFSYNGRGNRSANSGCEYMRLHLTYPPLILYPQSRCIVKAIEL